MNLREFLGLVATLSVLAMSYTVWAADSPKELVRVRGSESMAHMMTVYASEFGPGNPNCNIVVSGGAVGPGVESLVNGDTEIAMMSERMSQGDLNDAKAKGLNLQEAVVGWGAIVIITHPSNPVESLTVDQLAKLLRGEFTRWNQVGGPDKAVTVVAMDEKIRGGTYRFVTDTLLKGNFAPGARLVNYFRSVPPTVSETEGAIGLIRLRNLERLVEQGVDQKIKVIAMKKDEGAPAVAPSRESVEEGTYPITRPYFLYISGKTANKCTLAFFKFCESRNPRPRDAGDPSGSSK